MRQRVFVHLVMVVWVIAFVSGCMPKMTLESIKQMQPPRPVELDRLEMLLGEWETTGEVRMAVLDEPMRTTGSNIATWALDRRMVVEHASLDMGPLGKMTGMSIWSWDPTIKKYRMWWFDSFGETAEAVVTYDEATETWHMRGTGQKYGYKTSGRGTLRRVDDDTLEWTWKEYDALGLIKFADMKGVSRRK